MLENPSQEIKPIENPTFPLDPLDLDRIGSNEQSPNMEASKTFLLEALQKSPCPLSSIQIYKYWVYKHLPFEPAKYDNKISVTLREARIKLLEEGLITSFSFEGAFEREGQLYKLAGKAYAQKQIDEAVQYMLINERNRTQEKRDSSKKETLAEDAAFVLSVIKSLVLNNTDCSYVTMQEILGAIKKISDKDAGNIDLPNYNLSRGRVNQSLTLLEKNLELRKAMGRNNITLQYSLISPLEKLKLKKSAVEKTEKLKIMTIGAEEVVAVDLQPENNLVVDDEIVKNTSKVIPKDPVQTTSVPTKNSTANIPAIRPPKLETVIKPTDGGSNSETRTYPGGPAR